MTLERSGGDGEIRTHGPYYYERQVSNLLPSATRPRLQNSYRQTTYHIILRLSGRVSLVGIVRLELTRLSALASKTSVATNYTISPFPHLVPPPGLEPGTNGL